MEAVRVKAPATTANLGSAFDCAGMALELYNEVVVSLNDRDIVIIDGEGKHELSHDSTNLVYRAIAKVADCAGIPLPPLKIHCTNRIPLSKGMGSSAAAIVGGVVAGNALLGVDLSSSDLLDLAAQMEGHPDNVAPALFGGFVISCKDKQHRIVSVRVDAPDDLFAVLAVPEHKVSTREARAVLPDVVAHEDAVFNVSRAALLVAALQQRRYDLLATAMEDRLHQPYRAPLVSGLQRAVSAAIESGAVGAAISGAGPSVIAFCARDVDSDGTRIGEAMVAAFRGQGLQCRVIFTRPTNIGALESVEHLPI